MRAAGGTAMMGASGAEGGARVVRIGVKSARPAPWPGRPRPPGR